MIALLVVLSVGKPIDFNTEIRPILSDRCFKCHGPDAKNRKRGLRLDTPEGLTKDIDGDHAVMAGDPDKSVLFQRVTTKDEDDRMPPADVGPALTPKQVDLLRRWIAEGAKWQGHWAFEPVRKNEPPAVDSWTRNGIDPFIYLRLKAEGLTPSAEADRVTLIRRVSLDLLGLPPTPQEVAAFVADKRANAYERLVDRLLTSPHHGERWGRHWLDLARYADSNGYSIDSPRRIWKYRDWVIDAINRDLPFDQFTVEQIAGDLLPGATLDQRIATGFHRNTMLNEEGGIDKEQFRIDAVADRVATTGSVFLGLTLGCARCHDHKFDPISQKEYFQFFAFFNDADEPTLEMGTPDEIKRFKTLKPKLDKMESDLNAYQRKWLKTLSGDEDKAVPTEIATITALGTNQRDDKQWKTLFDYLKPKGLEFPQRIKAIEEIRKQVPRYATTLIMEQRKEPRETHVHIGGDFTRPSDLVTPGVLQVMHKLPATPGRPTRLDLARWLVAADNSLLTRVTVNRVWQQYFGLGLVETESDFGTQGGVPSHPELLDWLANQLPARGWSMKALHRLIVTSATYRQASRQRPELDERDARNRLLGRQNRLRLEGEVIRDSALAVSGMLDRRVGGPSVFPPQPDGVFGFTQIPRVWNTSTGGDRHRRGLYTYIWRSAPHPSLLVFDSPDGQFTCTRRNRSTTPLQALTLLNDQAFVELAQGFARRVEKERASDRERIAWAFTLATGRAPQPAERERLERFLVQQRASFKQAAPAWAATTRVILNLDEFITRE